jgi:transcriptional regulator with XRE-family HTH domain
MTQTLSEHVTLAVRAEVRRQGVTQRWIGEQLGLSQPQIHERLHGVVEWRNSELERLARVLDVPVTDFLPTSPAGTPGRRPVRRGAA